MFASYPIAALMGACACACAWYARDKVRGAASDPPSGGTLVDAHTPERVEELVRLLEREDGADALALRVEAVLLAFPPDDGTMQRLSLMQQRTEGSGDAREYSVTLVFSVAMTCVARTPRPRVPRRRHSWPIARTRHFVVYRGSRIHPDIIGP